MSGVRTLIFASLCACAVACTRAGTTEAPTLPPADVYETAPDFSGTWRGEVREQEGTLRINAYDVGLYRGVYRAEGVKLEYVLKLEQSMQGDPPRPTNRLTFTWQDGRGGLGTGWLLINRQGSALTGAFGEGGGHSGGTWTFSRT